MRNAPKEISKYRDKEEEKTTFDAVVWNNVTKEVTFPLINPQVCYKRASFNT